MLFAGPTLVCWARSELCKTDWTDRDAAAYRAESCVGDTVSCAKPAGRIKMLLAGPTAVGSVKHVLDVDAYWHHLANTIDRFVRGSDAAMCQITLTTFLPAY